MFTPVPAKHHTALLLINGGRNPLGPIDPLYLLGSALLSQATGSVMALVNQIPNQPLLFPDEESPVAEDTLVAYSWDKAMSTGDPTWVAYLPMTKASVRHGAIERGGGSLRLVLAHPPGGGDEALLAVLRGCRAEHDAGPTA